MYTWDADRIRFYEDASERTGFYSCVTKLLYPALSREKTICDAGCGLGYLSLHLAPYVKSVSAIDCNGDAIRVLKKNAETIPNIHPLSGRIEELPPRVPYDTMIFCFFGTIEETVRIAKAQCAGKAFSLKKNYSNHRFSVTHHSFGKNPVEHAEAFFTKHGISYDVRLFSIEYGQPFRTLADAFLFSSLYSRKEDADKVTKERLAELLIETGDPFFPWYLPQKRDLGLLSWNAADYHSED